MSEPLAQVEQIKPQLKAAFYATKPTGWTLFWRTFLPWQVWRFIRINLKMMWIIRKNHKGI